jgi:hypothetical protein
MTVGAIKWSDSRGMQALPSEKSTPYNPLSDRQRYTMTLQGLSDREYR